MGWVFIIVAALAVLALLWRFGRLDRNGLQFAASAMFLALAGYAWQGHPGQAGAPKHAPAQREVSESDFTRIRHDLLGRFDNADYWLTLAEGYGRDGDTRGASEILEAGIRQHPRDPDLWVGLGSTLVQHAGGMMTPAAQLAFDRAAEIAPDHPAPKFFYGLALAQGGKLDQAEKVWRDLLATAPPSAMWRAAIEERLKMIDALKAQEGGTR